MVMVVMVSLVVILSMMVMVSEMLGMMWVVILSPSFQETQGCKGRGA